MNWEVWGPPLVVLGVAAGIGAAVAVWTVSKGGVGTARNREEELGARKDQLIEALRELEADRGKLDEATWAARREALLSVASDTLRALETPTSAAVQASAATPASPAPQGSGSRRMLWASVMAIFFGALAALLVQSVKPRAQGETMTGGMNQGTDAPDPAEVAARAALEKNPKDLDALNTMTWLAIQAQDMNAAMSYLGKARDVSPNDPYVLTHLAVLSMQVGMNDKADESLNTALQEHPGLPRALLFRGLLHFQTEDKDGAQAALNQVLSSTEATGQERQIASQILAEGNKPPVSDRLSGTVTLAPGVNPPSGGLLFIIARRSATPGGPPLAAVRKPGPTFPFAFTVTDDNMMLGGDWPDEVWLQARLDSDGDPTTKSPTDVESPVLGPLKSGTADLTLVLGGR